MRTYEDDFGSVCVETLERRMLLAADGMVDWQVEIGQTNQITIFDIAAAPDGGVYAVGPSQSPGWAHGGYDVEYGGSGDGAIARLDRDGNVLWSAYIGAADWDQALGVCVDAEGNAYVAGATYRSSGSGMTITAFVTKVSPAGERLWYTELDSLADFTPEAITLGGNGDIYLGGIQDRAGIIARLNTQGQLIFSKTIGNEYTRLFDLAIGPDGDIYAAGLTWDASLAVGGYDTTYDGDQDGIVLRMSLDGTLRWATYVGGANAACTSLALGPAGQVYVTGVRASDFLLELGPSGSLVRSHSSGSAYPIVDHVEVDAAGNVYLAGITPLDDFPSGNATTSTRVVVAKCLPDATIAWVKYFDTLTNGTEMNLSPDGDLFVAFGDNIAQESSVARLSVGERPISIEGTAGADVIHVRRENDRIYWSVNGVTQSRWAEGVSGIYISAGAGNDRITIGDGVGSATVYAGAGDDTIISGDGDDLLYGGDGHDLIHAGAGNDTVYGNFGGDSIYAGDGHDQVFGGIGRDSIHGDAGDDLLLGGNGMDTIRGGAGNDEIWGKGKADSLFGGAGDDTIYSGAGSDLIVGGRGNDVLYAGAHPVFRDTLDGGEGEDQYEADDDDLLIAVEVPLA